MDIDKMSNFVAVVGVPTFLCICLFFYFAKKDKTTTEKTDKMRESLDNNTRAIERLQISQEQSNREMVNVIGELLRYLQRGERKNE